MEQQQLTLFGVDIKKEKEIEKPKQIVMPVINQDLIFDDNLRDYIFLEDETGRLRERIIDLIEKYGVANWFLKKGFPTTNESIWKNRYTGEESTFEKEIGIGKYSNFNDIQKKGYYLWENWLPVGKWNEKELFRQYKKGTSEYFERIRNEEKELKDRQKKESKKKYPAKIEPIKPVVMQKVKVTLNEDYNWASGDNYWLKEPVESWNIAFDGYGCLANVGCCVYEGRTIEDVWKEYEAKMREEGYTDIEVVRSPRTEDKLISMKKQIAERKKYYQEQERIMFEKNGEKDIKDYSEKLKKLLSYKYKCPVTIKIFRENGNAV